MTNDKQVCEAARAWRENMLNASVAINSIIERRPRDGGRARREAERAFERLLDEAVAAWRTDPPRDAVPGGVPEYVKRAVARLDTDECSEDDKLICADWIRSLLTHYVDPRTMRPVLTTSPPDTARGAEDDRCGICGGELSNCGAPDEDGIPSLDCQPCILREELEALRAKVPEGVRALAAKVPRVVFRGRVGDAERRIVLKDNGDYQTERMGRDGMGAETWQHDTTLQSKVIAQALALLPEWREPAESREKQP